MRRLTPLGSLLLLLVATTRVAALDPARTILQYNRTSWGVAQGLEGFSVNCVVESRDGYIWIATDEGLARFDGVHFATYNHETAPVMTSDDVACLTEDRDGALWFGTRGGGLYRLRGDSLTRFGTAEGLGGENPIALHVDREGTLWIGMQEYGVAKFQGGGFKRYTLRSGMGLNANQTFYERADGTLFFAYGSLYERPPGSDAFAEVYPYTGYINSLLEEGGTLIAAVDTGLLAVAPAAGRPPLGGTASGMFVRSLLRDHDGNIWIATEGNGLLRYNGGRVVSYTAADGLPSDRLISLYEDSQGSLWITSRGGGLSRLRDIRIAVYGKSEGLTGDIISAVFEDHRGTWWVGTRGKGVNLLRDGNVVARIAPATGLSDSIIRSIAEGPPGTIWIGTQRGLNRITVDSRDRITSMEQFMQLAPPYLRPVTVRALTTARDGTVWLGEYGQGIFTVKGSTIVPMRPFTPQVLGSGVIHVLYEDAAGTMWAGTHAGLYGIHAGAVTHYGTEQGMKNGLVYALHEDEQHALWIGTYGGGLDRLKDGKIASISRNQGLFDDVIFAILDDSLGSFWMSCNRGIFSVTKRELNAVADGRSPTLTCDIYGTAQGLRSAECNGGAQPAAIRTGDGRLLFPTMDGLVVIDPKLRQAAEPHITARLEEIRVDTVRYSPLVEHQLPIGNRTIDFHYTALGAADPGRIEFQYRLDGFEDLMVDAGTQRSARYTNVPPGVYTLTVMARVPGGTWSAPATSARIIVPPHIYETWWMKTLVGLLVAVAAGLMFRYVAQRQAARRIEQLEREHALERERARIARDMHDEIGASLTQITILSELLGRNLRIPDAAEPFVQKISSTARDVVASLDEIVWFITPRHDSLESLLLYIREYVADYLDAIDIGCSFAFPEKIPALVLAADVRRNIFLAVKEAVTNIAKHSGATVASLSAEIAGGTLEICINDNGRGFEGSSGSPLEDGLRNMEKRLRDVGGETVIKSDGGGGTSVTLRAPV